MRPLIRAGRVASDPKFNFSVQGKDQGRCIAYEGFSYGGSSGSPVYDLKRHKLIDINAGHLNNYELQTHSGISYFYQSSIILEILRDNGVPFSDSKL
jgi:V8-like Glu-specific endopeptidase